jgi:hypothetical protein
MWCELSVVPPLGSAMSVFGFSQHWVWGLSAISGPIFTMFDAMAHSLWENKISNVKPLSNKLQDWLSIQWRIINGQKGIEDDSEESWDFRCISHLCIIYYYITARVYFQTWQTLFQSTQIDSDWLRLIRALWSMFDCQTSTSRGCSTMKSLIFFSPEVCGISITNKFTFFIINWTPKLVMLQCGSRSLRYPWVLPCHQFFGFCWMSLGPFSGLMFTLLCVHPDR